MAATISNVISCRVVVFQWHSFCHCDLAAVLNYHSQTLPHASNTHRLCDMKRLADAVRAGKGSLKDLELYLAFLNEYMYKVCGILRSKSNMLENWPQQPWGQHCSKVTKLLHESKHNTTGGVHRPAASWHGRTGH